MNQNFSIAAKVYDKLFPTLLATVVGTIISKVATNSITTLTANANTSIADVAKKSVKAAVASIPNQDSRIVNTKKAKKKAKKQQAVELNIGPTEPITEEQFAALVTTVGNDHPLVQDYINRGLIISPTVLPSKKGGSQ